MLGSNYIGNCLTDVFSFLIFQRASGEQLALQSGENFNLSHSRREYDRVVWIWLWWQLSSRQEMLRPQTRQYPGQEGRMAR